MRRDLPCWDVHAAKAPLSLGALNTEPVVKQYDEYKRTPGDEVTKEGERSLCARYKSDVEAQERRNL